MKMYPTPKGNNCPICGDTDCMMYAVDCTRYYRVTDLNAELIEGFLDSTETGEEVRLFCNGCGEHFEPPEAEYLV